MLSKEFAQSVVNKAFPDSEVTGPIDSGSFYVFRIIDSDPLEGEWDPFYSVNKITGELRDFSIITDGDTKTILDKFEALERT